VKVYLHLLPLSLFFIANLILFLSAIILYIKSKNNSTVNISERKETEEAFLDSERKLRKIVETSNEGICFLNSDGSLIFVNEKLAEIIGRDAQEILGKSLFDFMDKESIEKAKEKLKDRKNDVKEIFDSKFIKKNGEEVWTIVSATPYFDDNKKNYDSIAIVSNITPIKLFELQLKEKEALIKEIHHRVKNNLAIILSVIGIQYRKCDNEEVKTALEETRGRIKSISYIHENLCRSDDCVNINIKKYLNDLASYQYKNYISKNENIALKTDIDDEKINIERSIPIGLIINELLTNSLKYAFPSAPNGEIFISFKNRKDEYNLIVKDNGVGYRYDLDIDNVETTGFKIVSLLANQLNGKIFLNTKNGFETVITFPT